MLRSQVWHLGSVQQGEWVSLLVTQPATGSLSSHPGFLWIWGGGHGVRHLDLSEENLLQLGESANGLQMQNLQALLQASSWGRSLLSSPSQQLSRVGAAGLAVSTQHSPLPWEICVRELPAGRPSLAQSCAALGGSSYPTLLLQILGSQVWLLQVLLAYSCSLSPLSFTSIIPNKLLAFLNPFGLLDDPTWHNELTFFDESLFFFSVIRLF